MGLEDPATQKGLWVAALALLPVATIVGAKLLGYCFALLHARRTISTILVTVFVGLLVAILATGGILAWYYARSHFGWLPGEWIWILAIVWASLVASVFKTPLLGIKKSASSGSSSKNEED